MHVLQERLEKHSKDIFKGHIKIQTDCDLTIHMIQKLELTHFVCPQRLTLSWSILCSTSLIVGLSWWAWLVQSRDRGNMWAALPRTSFSMEGNSCLSGGNRHRHTSHISTPKLYTSILGVCLLRSSVLTSGAAYTAAPSAGVLARWLRLADPKSDSLPFHWLSRPVLSKRTFALLTSLWMMGVGVEVGEGRGHVSQHRHFAPLLQQTLLVG